jgi:hypothetical protein
MIAILTRGIQPVKLLPLRKNLPKFPLDGQAVDLARLIDERKKPPELLPRAS